MKHIISFLENIETVITDVASRVGPWLLPLVTAGLVYRAAIARLAWPIWQALTAAAGLELFGLGATGTALTLWGYNRSKRKSDPSAPAGLALALTGVYFAVVSALVVVIEILPSAATWTPLAFPILSAAAGGILVLRADHRARLADIESVKSERQASRQEKRQASRQEVDAQPSGEVSNIGKDDNLLDRLQAGKKRKHDARLDTLERFYLDNPTAGATEAARFLGVSRQTIYGYWAELEAAGRISKNGKVEVVGGAQ